MAYGHGSSAALSADQPCPQPDAGGDDRARTGDLLRAREALSQLSYVPILSAPDRKLSGGPSWI